MRSRLAYAGTCRNLRRVLFFPSVWERLDFSDVGDVLGDREFEHLVRLVAGWVRRETVEWGVRSGNSTVRALVLASMREVILDGTDVSLWTIIGLLQQADLLHLSFTAPISNLVAILEGRTWAQKENDFVCAKLSLADSRLRSLRVCAPEDVRPRFRDIVDLIDAARETFPNLIIMHPFICYDCDSEVILDSKRIALFSTPEASASHGNPEHAWRRCRSCVDERTCHDCGAYDSHDSDEMQGLDDELSFQIAAMSSEANFLSLPIETVANAFSYLPIASRVRVAFASRLLAKVAEIPSVWGTVDFTGVSSLGDHEFEQFLACTGERIAQSLGLSRAEGRAILLARAQHVLLGRTNVTMWTVAKLLQQPNLVTLSFDGCAQVSLKDLTLFLEKNVSMNFVECNLESLTVSARIPPDWRYPQVDSYVIWNLTMTARKFFPRLTTILPTVARAPSLLDVNSSLPVLPASRTGQSRTYIVGSVEQAPFAATTR
ncbi:hypothetical protein HDU93_005420 [Gonapodya sp. JEL0774]|nr:hypothetical protein HDU93_005420 [Gonapodya sp. JEL0774]